MVHNQQAEAGRKKYVCRVDWKRADVHSIQPVQSLSHMHKFISNVHIVESALWSLSDGRSPFGLRPASPDIFSHQTYRYWQRASQSRTIVPLSRTSLKTIYMYMSSPYGFLWCATRLSVSKQSWATLARICYCPLQVDRDHKIVPECDKMCSRARALNRSSFSVLSLFFCFVRRCRTKSTK